MARLPPEELLRKEDLHANIIVIILVFSSHPIER